MEITIKELCQLLKEKLNSCSCLTHFYIGKTDDFDQRTTEHIKEGYTSVVELAHSSPECISKAETYLIESFKEDDKCFNKNSISSGNNLATILYVAIRIQSTNIDELDDDDMEWDASYELSNNK